MRRQLDHGYASLQLNEGVPVISCAGTIGARRGGREWERSGAELEALARLRTRLVVSAVLVTTQLARNQYRKLALATGINCAKAHRRLGDAETESASIVMVVFAVQASGCGQLCCRAKISSPEIERPSLLTASSFQRLGLNRTLRAWRTDIRCHLSPPYGRARENAGASCLHYTPPASGLGNGTAISRRGPGAAKVRAVTNSCVVANARLPVDSDAVAAVSFWMDREQLTVHGQLSGSAAGGLQTAYLFTFSSRTRRLGTGPPCRR